MAANFAAVVARVSSASPAAVGLSPGVSGALSPSSAQVCHRLAALKVRPQAFFRV
jgi:hypothetical protein